MAVGDLVIMQGTTSVHEIAVRDSDGSPITSWTGYSVRGQIRPRIGSPDLLYEWTSQGDSPNVTFEGSTVLLSVPAPVSSAWEWTLARYDVELTTPSGQVARIAEGHVIVDRETTT